MWNQKSLFNSRLKNKQKKKKLHTSYVWKQKLTLSPLQSTSPNPCNTHFMAKYEIITLTYAKLFINPLGLIFSSHRRKSTHTNGAECQLTKANYLSSPEFRLERGCVRCWAPSCSTTWDSAPPALIWHRHLVVTSAS